VIKYGEVKAVDVGYVAELAARDIVLARPLSLDHIGTQQGQELGAGWTRLHVGEIENSDSV
jgi:hypothetical protein